MGSILQRPDLGGSTSPQVVSDAKVLAESLPVLTAYLVDHEYADGSARQVATLLVFTEDGSWKVCLNDRSQGRSAWCSGPSVREALMSLERALTDGTASWRKSGTPAGRGVKK